MSHAKQIYVLSKYINILSKTVSKVHVNNLTTTTELEILETNIFSQIIFGLMDNEWECLCNDFEQII